VQIGGPPWFGVDVCGFTPEHDLVWAQFSSTLTQTPSLTREELLALFQPISDDESLDEMCGETWFVQPAKARAEKWIDAHFDVFSGKQKKRL
jgi:hypothetical protein